MKFQNLKNTQKQKYFENSKIEYLYDDNIGSVEYVQHMGDDLTIVNAARVSFGVEKNEVDERDKKLIRYLVKNRHTSTLEHNVITFRFTVPLFVRGQHHRHRTWSYNEISRRYTAENLRFYEPKKFRTQHKSNRQASNASDLIDLTGTTIHQAEIGDVFTRAQLVSSDRAKKHYVEAEKSLIGLDDLNQEQLDRSFRLLCVFEDIVEEKKANSLAVRCWPETFTEYGCAACAPMAMMSQAGVPSACEADVFGSITTLLLQELVKEPAWMADLVDIDEADNTAVLWHCGLAPISMCDPRVQAEATIHTNRKMPLLHQFPLKPGRITLARLSQAKNKKKLMIAGAEVLRAPMSFTGTSGVIRFDKRVDEVCSTIMEEGLEHHYSLAYGDHTDTLQQVAHRLDIPVLQLA